MANKTVKNLLKTLKDYAYWDYRYSLPPAFYTANDWLKYETKHLLRQEWLCLGRVEEVATSGDYITLEILGESLLIARGEDNIGVYEFATGWRQSRSHTLGAFCV